MISFLDYLKSTYRINKSLSGLSIFKHKNIYTEWRSQVELKKSPLDLELPWITIIAKNFIENFLKNKSKTEIKVFEYGSGGSSLFFLKYSSLLVSIEHDEKWFELVSNEIKNKKVSGWDGHLIKPEQIGDYHQLNLDASDPQHFYTMDENFLNCTFRNYVSYIDKFPDSFFDVILIDGRSRPSCLFHSLNKVKKGGLLVLDNAERDYYLSKLCFDEERYKLVLSANTAVICSDAFTKTNIYLNK